jgi:hypothetical protein
LNHRLAARLNAPSADMPIDFAAVTKVRLVVIATNATLRNAAVALSSPHIGLVIICEENATVAGVVSESDLVRHLMLDRPEDELSDINETHEKGAAGPNGMRCLPAAASRQTYLKVQVYLLLR